VWSAPSGSQRLKHRCGGLLAEEVLGLAADLDEPDIGKAGFPARPNGVNGRV
jgi:hypothetical protein